MIVFNDYDGDYVTDSDIPVICENAVRQYLDFIEGESPARVEIVFHEFNINGEFIVVSHINREWNTVRVQFPPDSDIDIGGFSPHDSKLVDIYIYLCRKLREFAARYDVETVYVEIKACD